MSKWYFFRLEKTYPNMQSVTTIEHFLLQKIEILKFNCFIQIAT